MINSSRTDQNQFEENQALNQKIQELERLQSEYRRVEEKLRKNEERFLNFIQATGQYVYEIDVEGRFVFVNEHIKSLGYAPQELMGKTVFDIMASPEEAARVRGLFVEDVMNLRAFRGTEVQCLTQDGQICTVSISGLPVIGSDGKLQGYQGAVEDITMRKLMEAALLASECRYKTIFETTGTTMLIVEDDMTISLINDKFENLTGYTREDVQGKRKWTEFVEKDDLERMVTQHQLRRANSGFTTNSYEFRLVHKDGCLKNILLTVALIPGTKKSVASLLDITIRKQAEEAFRESEAMLRSVFKATPIGLCVVKDRIFKSMNNAWLEIVGYTESDMLGKTPRILYANDEEYERVGRVLFGSLSERGLVAVQTKHRRKDGMLRDVKLIATPLHPEDPSQGTVVTVEDITGRKRIEEELKESRREMEHIIEFLPDATLVIDKDGKVIAWNRAIETMTGIKKEEMIGKGNYEYALPFYGDRRPILIDLALHPDLEKERPYTAIQRVGDNIMGEAFTPCIPPGDVHLSATASVLRNEKGEIIAAIECIRDNTERRKLEERLNRAQKMEALGTLAGGVAHDLNNVLGVLVGYSELLQMQLPEDSLAWTYTNNILQSSVRGAAIIQDLLTMARRGVTVSEVVNLNELILNYLKTPELEKLIFFHPGVKIWSDLDTGLLPIKGSPVHLGKTIMNLVSNAVEAIPGQGEITIKTENRYLDRPIRGYDEMAEGDFVLMTVSDTGAGISADDLGKIFEPFYTKKVMGRSGTGLGLAVVWGAVKDHHGYIDVRSEEGEGTTFALYFPVTREEPSKVEKVVSPSAYRGRGESILVVDDVKEQRELAIGMLGRLGYEVEAVASGEEAVEYLRHRNADLIVLDMIMEPGIDGLETYRRILDIHPEQKAMIVSGFSETDRVKQAQDMGAGSFVQKPYILEKIGLAIRAELDPK